MMIFRVVLESGLQIDKSSLTTSSARYIQKSPEKGSRVLMQDADARSSEDMTDVEERRFKV